MMEQKRAWIHIDELAEQTRMRKQYPNGFQSKHMPTDAVLNHLWEWAAEGRVTDFVDYLAERYPLAPGKVIYAKLEKLDRTGLIECGTSLRHPWLTDKGTERVGRGPMPTRWAHRPAPKIELTPGEQRIADMAWQLLTTGQFSIEV